MKRLGAALLPLTLLVAACTTTPTTEAAPSTSMPTLSPTVSTSTPTKPPPPPRVRLPDVTSHKLFQAVQRLKDLGFKVAVKQRLDLSAFIFRQGIVIDQRPQAGDIREGRGVTLFVQPPCTPGYSPCLPPAIDYDCAGIWRGRSGRLALAVVAG